MSTLDYTIQVEGSNFVVRDSSGSLVAQNTDFGALMNALDAYLSDKTVLLKTGTYTAVTDANLSKSNVAINGEVNAILKALPALPNYLWQPTDETTGIVFNSLTFDGNGNTTISPVLLMRGAYNTVQNCTFKNIMRYALETFKGSHITFQDNTFLQQQYGVGVSGSSGASIWAQNCIVKRNNIRNSMDCGVKLRWCRGTLVTLNQIEVGYDTWTDAQLQQYGHNPIYGCDGVVFYHGDGPTQENVVTFNTIIDSKRNKITVGIFASNDSLNLSSGDLATYNTIDGLYTGILMQWPFTARFNTILNTRYAGIHLAASGSVAEYNLISAGAYYGGLIEANNCIFRNNKIMGCATDLKDTGIGNTVTGNLYDKTAIGRSKVSTSSTPVSSPLIVHGVFELAVNEVFYTEQGSTIVFGAKAVTGYNLSSFRVNGVDHAPDINGLYTLTVGAQDYTVQAIYVTVPLPQTFKLNLNATTGGTTNPSPRVLEYPLGAAAVVTALPSTGYKLQQWELDGAVYTENPISVVMNEDHVLLAVFVAIPPPILSHILVVTTVPIIGVPIILNGQNYFTPTPPITLPEGSHSVSCPSNVIIGSDTYNFSQWEDGSTNPQRMFPLTADATIMATYVLVQPPPAKGSIEVHAFLESTEIVASGVIVETGQTFQTPTTIIVDPGTYVVRVTNGTQVKEQWAVVTKDQTIRLDFQFQPPAPISPLPKVLQVLAPILIGGISLSIQRRG